MTETYRKWGRSVRLEMGHVLRVEEAGEAIEQRDQFSAGPVDERRPMEEPSVETVEAVGHRIARIVKPLALERVVVASGIALHEFEGRTWEERTDRVHVAATHKGLRVLVDFATFDDMSDLETAVDALARATTAKEAPQRVRLAPPVAAALLPNLVGVAPPNVTLYQSEGGFDGKGKPVERTTVGQPPWPNWYRPSYRVRPVRMPLNVAAECAVTLIEDELPRAVALLAPPDGLTLHVICVDGRRVYPTQILVNRIDAVANETRWYPYAAGSFGAEMML